MVVADICIYWLSTWGEMQHYKIMIIHSEF